jgi:hypothetical protein
MLTSIKNISVPSDPRDVIFIRNGSVMITSIAGTNHVVFYNLISPTSYVLISTLTAPNTSYFLYRVNDGLLHVATLLATHRFIHLHRMIQ